MGSQLLGPFSIGKKGGSFPVSMFKVRFCPQKSYAPSVLWFLGAECLALHVSQCWEKLELLAVVMVVTKSHLALVVQVSFDQEVCFQVLVGKWIVAKTFRNGFTVAWA